MLWSLHSFRILALDHGLLSFSDETYNQLPAVMVTNPKSARYIHPGHDSLESIRSSTHIRYKMYFLCISNMSYILPG